MKDFFAQLGKLLRFEFRKLFRRKTLYFAFGLMFLMTFSIISINLEQLAEEEMGFILSTLTFGSMLASAFDYLYNYSLSTLCVFGAIIVGLVLCEDYSKGTIKLIVGRGYSKTAAYTAKMITVVICSLIMGVCAPFFGALLGTVTNGVGMSLEGFGKTMSESNAFASFTMFFAVMFIFMLVGVLVKKSGAAIAICVGGLYISEILILVVELVMSANDVELESIATTINTLKNVFPLFYVSAPTLLDLGEQAVSSVGAFVGAAAWIVIAASLGEFIAYKRDC